MRYMILTYGSQQDFDGMAGRATTFTRPAHIFSSWSAIATVPAARIKRLPIERKACRSNGI